MKTTIKLASIFLVISALSSCALRSIESSYDYQKNKIENKELYNLGKGKILIYNGAGGAHKIDNTARLNLWIDGKPMGQFKANEFAIIELDNGLYEFELVHIDMFKFRSKHTYEIRDDTKVIRIEPTITSNNLTITNEFPKNIGDLKYVKK